MLRDIYILYKSALAALVRTPSVQPLCDLIGVREHSHMHTRSHTLSIYSFMVVASIYSFYVFTDLGMTLHCKLNLKTESAWTGGVGGQT